MLTLSLLRHAKSSWDDTELDDFERPLAKRGVKAAVEIGTYLAGEKLRPDIILCSAAVRTRGTVALILPDLGQPPPEVLTEEALYLAMPATLLDRLRKLKPDCRHTLLVGHNPGMHQLALELIGDGDRDAIASLAMGFPTAGLAVMTFDLDKWAAIKPASGRLERFITPRSLP